MTPTLVTAYSVNDATTSNSTLTTVSFTPAAGEVIIVTAGTADNASIVTGVTNTGTAQTWVSRYNSSPASNCTGALYSCTVGASPTAMTVSMTFGGGTSGGHGIFVSRWSNGQLAASPVVSGTTTAAGTTSITTVSANSIVVWGLADWQAVAPGTPTYANSGIQLATPFLATAQETQYSAYLPAAAAGARTFGVTAPTGMQANIAGIEIQSAAATPISGPDTGTSLEGWAVTAGRLSSESGVVTDTAAITAPTTSSESGTVTDTGAISIPISGSDPGVAAETWTITIPIAGPDSGSVVEGFSSVGLVSGPDAATAADIGQVTAQLALPADPGATAETVTIGVTGADSGVAAEPTPLIHAVLTPTSDTGTGTDGGAVELFFGSLAVGLTLSLWAVTSSGLAPLPDFEGLSLSPLHNAPGAMSVNYPADGINFALLYNNLVNDRDIEVEIWLTGDSSRRLRGYLQESSGDDASESRMWSFAGEFLEQRMSEAILFPQVAPLGNAAQELVFGAATAGVVMGTLLTQAQARGALTDITKDFTNTLDSNGIAWPTVVTTKFSPSGTYATILETLVGLGLCEWSITPDHVFHLYGPNGKGTDLTTGPTPIILRRGRNMTQAPIKHSVRQSPTAVLVAGANGLYVSQTNASAQTRRGRRIESASSAANLTDSGSVTAFAASELQILTPGLREITLGLGFLPGEPQPGKAFNVGDWIFVDTLGTMIRYRVVQWSLTQQGGSTTPTGVVVLNDATTDRLSALAERLTALTSGSAVVGTSGGPDTGVPNPPTSLTASSTAYLDGSQTKASVQVGWTAPVLNTNSTVISDLAGFNVQFSYASSPTVWVSGGVVNSPSLNSITFVANPAVSITIRVNAFDTVGNTSAWSATLAHLTAAYTNAPPQPSTPSVSNYLGVLRITWDGNTNVGGSMLSAAPAFDHINVHISTTSNFTPTTATYFDTLFAAGTQVYTLGVYGTTYYAKLVAVDRNGNFSTPSGQGSSAPSQILSADLFANCVGTAQLQDLVVVTAKIANLAVNDAQIGNLQVGKLTAGIMTASVTLSGIIRTAVSGARSEIDAAGIRLYNGGGANTVNLNANDGSILLRTATAGARSEFDGNGIRLYNGGGSNTVNFNANDGSVFITGQLQTASSGKRFILNPSNSAPDTMRIYPSGSGDYAQIQTVDSPVDGSAAILIDGGVTAGVGRGRIGAYRNEAFTAWIVDGEPLSRCAYSANGSGLNMWSQSAVNFDKYIGNTKVVQSHVYITWVTGAGGANVPCFTANDTTTNAGFKLDQGRFVTTINEGQGNARVAAAGYDTVSSQRFKTDITDIRTVLTPLDIIRGARAKAYKMIDDVATHGIAAPLRFGPLAEDLPNVLTVMVPQGAEMVPGVSLGDQIGLLWAAENQRQDQQIISSSAVAIVPVSTIIRAGTTLEVTVVWDSTPPAVPTGGFATINSSIIWAGKVTAWLKSGTATATGAVVVFKNISTASVVAAAGAGISASVVGLGLYSPPFVG